MLPSSGGKTDAWTSRSSLSASMEELSDSAVQIDAGQRSRARREAEIWFGFSHPHVIRLFGACHVGRPFFVCEYATNGTLVGYLRKHPDELWSKLHEAALGVQYLHARGVVHGDLKGNNIVVGSDFKAKVTDFGLSSAASSEDMAQISGAWHWVAPECFSAGEAQQQQRLSFASDVYSLGMCIVEALRVVEAVKAGKDPRHCLPWRVADRNAVKYHATHGTLPAPPTCSDSQWKLVKRMCALEPTERIKISTVVDELARLANPGINTQAMEPDALPADAMNRSSVPDMIDAAQEELGWLQGDTDQHDYVLSLYKALWKRLECVHEQIVGNKCEGCHASFYSLVAEARASTSALQETKRGTMAVAETTMRYFALDRAMTKFCEAHFLHGDGGDKR